MGQTENKKIFNAQSDEEKAMPFKIIVVRSFSPSHYMEIMDLCFLLHQLIQTKS